MNGLDLAVLAILAVSAVFAFARGFVREALSIIAWVGAALITLYGFDPVYRIIVRFVTTPLLADLAAGAGLFLASLVALTLLTGYAARFVQASALSPIDRTLGLIFGLVRGALLVSLAYLVIDASLPQTDRPAWIREAKSEPALARGADLLRGILPQTLREKTASLAAQAQPQLDQAAIARRAMRALANPASPPDQAPPAYTSGEQRNLDRLIQNAR